MWIQKQELTGDYLRAVTANYKNIRTMDVFLEFLDDHLREVAELGVDHLYIGIEFLNEHGWSHCSRRNATPEEWQKFMDYFISREITIEYVNHDVLLSWVARV